MFTVNCAGWLATLPALFETITIDSAGEAGEAGEATKLSTLLPFPRRVESPWNQTVELSWTTLRDVVGGNRNPDRVRQIRGHLQFKSVD